MRKNPAAYGIPSNRLPEAAVEKVLKDQLILSNVKELTKYGMVRMALHSGFACSCIYLNARCLTSR